MRSPVLRLGAPVVLAVALAGGIAGALARGGGSEPHVTGGREALPVVDAWAATSSGAVAVYLRIDNGGGADRLVYATSDLAGPASLMHSDAGTAQAHDASPGAVDLAIPPGRTELLPGGSHLMFSDVERTLEPGDRLPLRLTFEEAGTVEVTVEIVTWDEVVERSA